MPIIHYKGEYPRIEEEYFIAPDAWVTGRVYIAKEVTILFGVAIRGDIHEIFIGEGSNFQEHAVVHTSRGLQPCTIGKNVTVGHHAMLHGCCVKDRCIIGMGATILDCAEIGEDCIIGAHTLVLKNAVIPPGCMVIGTPGKVLRSLNAAEIQEIKDSAEAYKKVGLEYRLSCYRKTQ